MVVAPTVVNSSGPGTGYPASGPLGHVCGGYRAFEGRPHGPVMASV
jgi:hypothetical protein